MSLNFDFTYGSPTSHVSSLSPLATTSNRTADPFVLCESYSYWEGLRYFCLYIFMKYSAYHIITSYSYVIRFFRSCSNIYLGLTAHDCVTLSKRFWDVSRHPLMVHDAAAGILVSIHYNLCLATIGRYARYVMWMRFFILL